MDLLTEIQSDSGNPMTEFLSFSSYTLIRPLVRLCRKGEKLYILTFCVSILL